MKATVEIPDPLFTHAEAQAAGLGTSLNDLLVTAIREHLSRTAAAPSPGSEAFGQRRRLLPEFARLQAEGAFRPKAGQRDVTELISEDRDGR